MIKINLINARSIFDAEVKLQKEAVFSTCDQEEAIRRIIAMDKKVIHTNEVITDGLKVVKELSFNESVQDFTQIALLDHDIGRFAQMRYIGNYADSDLKKYMGIKNHGVLGKQILEELIVKQLPDIECFYEPIKTIVNNHVDKNNPDEQLMILLTDLLKDYNIEELLSYPDYYKKIVSSITQIVQDVDRLDIYHQILDERWIPNKCEEDIDSKIFEMFYNMEYLDIALLKESGLWNSNVGELVRLSYINQIKLLSVAKVIQKENLIMKMKEKRQNLRVQDAFEYTSQILEEKIKNSTDGVTVGKVKIR